MRFRVRLLPRAESDLRRIVGYLRERSKPGTAAWLNAFRNARHRLADFADTYAECQEVSDGAVIVREISFKTKSGLSYRIIFTIVDDEVRIVRVRGPGQAPVDPSDLPPP